jgi:hypothetical protein
VRCCEQSRMYGAAACPYPLACSAPFTPRCSIKATQEPSDGWWCPMLTPMTDGVVPVTTSLMLSVTAHPPLAAIHASVLLAGRQLTAGTCARASGTESSSAHAASARDPRVRLRGAHASDALPAAAAPRRVRATGSTMCGSHAEARTGSGCSAAPAHAGARYATVLRAAARSAARRSARRASRLLQLRARTAHAERAALRLQLCTPAPRDAVPAHSLQDPLAAQQRCDARTAPCTHAAARPAQRSARGGTCVARGTAAYRVVVQSSHIAVTCEPCPA